MFDVMVSMLPSELEMFPIQTRQAIDNAVLQSKYLQSSSSAESLQSVGLGPDWQPQSRSTGHTVLLLTL